MASTTDQIQSAAPRNRELLEILSQTDHAASALEQHKRYIQDLDTQLRDVKKQLNQLGQERWKEQKDHKKYHDSIMRRWAYKVGGKKEKFAAKAEKEEKEYFEVHHISYSTYKPDIQLIHLRSCKSCIRPLPWKRI
jgi:hypothetical protein